MAESIQKEDLGSFKQYETYPSFLIYVTAFCTLTLLPFFVLPIIYYRDVKFLQRQYDITVSSPRYLYYIFSPFLLHGLSSLFYFRWRQERLLKAYNIEPAAIEEKQNELDNPKTEPLKGALYVEGFFLLLASIVLFLSLPVIIFYVCVAVLLLLGLVVNPTLVYSDLKRLSERNMGWESRRKKVIIALLSASIAFLLGYIIMRNLRVWTVAFNALRLEDRQKEITNMDSIQDDGFLEEPQTKEEERTSSGSVFEQKNNENT